MFLFIEENIYLIKLSEFYNKNKFTIKFNKIIKIIT